MKRIVRRYLQIWRPVDDDHIHVRCARIHGAFGPDKVNTYTNVTQASAARLDRLWRNRRATMPQGYITVFIDYRGIILTLIA